MLGSVTAEAKTKAPNAYVALGDSYTAAPLVPNPVGDPYDCGRSDHNYPHLVAAALKSPVFRDVSCASAQTKHMTQEQADLPFGGTNPPQFDALSPDTALVTIGIGGNDVGFGDAAQKCVQPLPPIGSSCKAFYTQGGRDQISERIKQAAPRVAKVLSQIRTRAPRARVFFVGYPSLLPDEGPGCYPYVPVLPEDVPWLRLKNKELNTMLKTQAKRNGATYVDWYKASIGHSMCELPGTAWVNGAVIVPPSYPAHPNTDGEAGAAVAVLAAITSSGFRSPRS